MLGVLHIDCVFRHERTMFKHKSDFFLKLQLTNFIHKRFTSKKPKNEICVLLICPPFNYF